MTDLLNQPARFTIRALRRYTGGMHWLWVYRCSCGWHDGGAVAADWRVAKALCQGHWKAVHV